MNWIEATAEPLKLYLAWQAPDHLKNRFRWAVATIEFEEGGCVLRYLQPGLAFEALNDGKKYEELKSLGFEGHPAFKTRHEIHRTGVMEVLMRRLPPRSRPDFREFRRQFRLSDRLEVSNFALLGLTEAMLPSDGFSVVDPLDPEAERCDLMLEMAGSRYYITPDADLPARIGAEVSLVPEPTNPYDDNAVQALVRGRKIGYINRLQAQTFNRWLDERRVTAVLERVNGDETRPRVFIFVKAFPNERSVAA